MSGDYAKHVRRRLRDGDIARYEDGSATCYLYRRDGGWYRLRVRESVYTPSEQRLGRRALDAAIQEHYPVRTVEPDEVPHTVRVASRDGADPKRLAAEWMGDARRLIDRLEEGTAGREQARELVAEGSQLAEAVADGEVEDALGKRMGEIAEALRRDD